MSKKEQTFDVYVGNVPKNITDTELKQVFLKYGEIKQVLCRWKEEFAGIGYAIVKFVYKADGERLLRETEEVSWNGHPLPIKAARRSDHNQNNGHSMNDNKPGCYSDFNPKQMFVTPSFLKGGPGYFCPTQAPFVNNHIKRPVDDYHLMTETSYFPNVNYHEEQSAHYVPLSLEVLCTNVEDAITFYGCSVHRFEELSNISHALNSMNFMPHKTDKKPLMKKVYGALFSEDRSWYRCIVTRLSIPNKPGVCTVRYIDYGNQEDIPYRNVVELPEQLHKVPAFASKFTFSNLTCESKNNKQTYLHQLINKRMSLCAIVSPVVNSEYQVLKCSCNGKDVISETVKRGFASFKKSQKASKQVTKSVNENQENKKNKAAVCNGTNGHSAEIQENGTLDSTNTKKLRKRLSNSKENSKQEISEPSSSPENAEESNFHPKMIIKRGSDLSDIVGSKEPTENKKEKESKQKSSNTTIDAVISNLKLINNIRVLVSQSTDDSIIQHAIELLQNEGKVLEIPEGQLSSIDKAFQSYIQGLDDIKSCTDKSRLPGLKLDRDTRREQLCNILKGFLKNFDISILERKTRILQTIVDLASNSNDWMNVELKTKPSTIKELVLEYNKVKAEKLNLVCKAREKTNETHKQFMEVYTELGKEFHLNTFEEDPNKSSSMGISNDGKRTSYSVKFNEALKNLGEAVDEEIHTLTLKKGNDTVSIIQCLLAELDVHKEKVESVCELYNKKLSMYNELCHTIDSEALLTQLLSVQEEVCSALLRHCRISPEADMVNSPPELPSVIRDLHIALLKEDEIIKALADAAEKYMPELCIEHPEFKLAEYKKHDALLKFNWKPEYFLNFETTSKRNSSFVSKLGDSPIVIKEYKHETKEDLRKFLQIAIVWNKCRCEYLLKIQALFFKEDNSIYAICPQVPGALLENPPTPIPIEGERACTMLRHLLICLKELHAQNLIYGAIHPSTILIDNGKILLDFCFNPKILEGNLILKGINFNPPPEEASEKSGDMYGFGCLVLWLLFPNLSFTSTEDGLPNLSAFRSIIEEALTTKDYTMLCSLISSKPKSRPSAAFLLNKGFLSNYELYCRVRNKAINSS